MSEGRIPTVVYIFILATIAGLGIGILVWLAPVSAAEMTPSQTTLHGAADWMLKGAIGAMLGFGGARVVQNRERGDSG